METEVENRDPNNPINRFLPPKTDFIYGPDPFRLVKLKDDQKDEKDEEAEKEEFFDIFRRPPSPRLELPDDSYFYLMVTGQVESAENNYADEMTIQYSFQSSSAWDMIHGQQTGLSQLACKSGGTNRKLIFNFPFELGYRSMNPKGWPQMILTCTGSDFYGRKVPIGYGNVHIPTTPGRHVRFVKTFLPASSSLLVRFIGWLKGRPAEYSDPSSTLATGAGREVTRVKSHGLVKVVFVVAQVNMDKFGF